MSKQLKYKLKKTLKNAEFVHADLEYHEELSQEALCDFQEEINKLLAALSVEDQQRIQDHLDRMAPPVAPPPGPQEPEPADAIASEEDAEEEPCTDLVNTDIEPDLDESPPKIDKADELKKLFRRIAERTHPDKVRASGFSNEQVDRLERLFIRAREAHDNENWYTLYSIATELGLDIEDLSDEEIEWIEEDIKKTLAKIAAISNLTAWHWYVGDDTAKRMALKFYFLQAFGFEHPEL
tara:strand:+ start:1432 stop:2145 length:714 start_codon:yes stop_codon:yes gene_type:complete